MYELEINRQTGTLNRLSLAADPGGINLTHRSTLTAFGAMTYTPKESRATLEPSGPPMNVEAVHLDERRAYAPVVEEGPGRIVGRNAATGHSITYELGDEGFDVWLEGDLPFADQVGLDLDVAFMDIDQDASELYQYTVQCPYCSEDRSVCYVYLSRPTAPGMLVVALTPALWRLRYGRGGFGEEGWIPPAYATPLHAVLGLQMLHRVDAALDPTSTAGPVRQGVRIRFPADIHEARQYMIREMGLPLLWAPTLGCEEGGTLRFAAGGPVGQAELVGPDGESSPVELTRVDDQTQVGEVTLPAEGFYSVVAKGGEGYTSDLTLRCGAPWLQALRRSVEEKAPVASFNSEGLFWAESMALARGWFGPHEHWDRCLYDMLVRIHMQGLAGEDLPSLPAPEPTDLLEKAKMAEGWYLRAPIPEAHTCAGKTFSPFHSFRNDRVQDTATLIELFLFGADAYGEEAFYQQAVRLCEAMVRDNIDETGRIYLVSFHDPNTTRDYTTVLPPAQHLVQVWMEMVKRGDERAGALREVLVKVGDYLVRRGMEFPTEGPQAHLRWTEDGSISCTALSLLYLYSHVEAKPAYLEFARQILDFHESWGMDAPDVRMHGSSFRYWETQWENDQEGRAINAGHPWTLWRAEALYWDAYVSGNARRLLQSWNGYWSNRCKFMPDGTTYSCFTPDYIPDRPRRFELVHSYPRTPDVSIACYLWPRVAETWLRTCAVIDTAAAGCKAVSGPVALNARLDPAGASDATLTPQAPFFERLFLLGEEIGPVRVEADRAIEVLADGPVEVLRGRGEGLDRPHAMRVQPEDGIIRLRRG
jgi:hypothetical protein